jgi:5-methyltetrahydropteroyltriglutamate--homocysteine methyltransferase
MFRASADSVLPTTIIGSLPRPSWYTETLGKRAFLDAMVNVRFREQYEDALSSFLRQQEVAGLDIVTDGDCRFDDEVGGQSWARYPLEHMDGFEVDAPTLAPASAHGVTYPRGHILHDYLEARVVPALTGPVGRGRLQYPEMWKAAQRMTARPVKFGTIAPELLAFTVEDRHYDDVRSRIMAISDALNAELHLLADAGCAVIQIEEPQIHLAPARGMINDVISLEFLLDVFNNTVKGLRAKTEVWCHTCWGNPAQQRLFADVQSYAPALETLNAIDADVITFEVASSGAGGTADLQAIGEQIVDKKIAIGVIDHHTLEVETPAEVADLGRLALEHIPAERLILCTDCGMGREGMSRRHAYYKMVSLVLGSNILRRELGLTEAVCQAADPDLSLIPSA